jgi:hypothetical protein
MAKRHLAAIAAIVLGLTACGPDGSDDSSSGSAGSKEVVFTGTYDVEGKTVEKESGATRAVSGMVIVAQEGDDYTVTFDLDTAYPSPDGPIEAQLIGRGTGKVEGETLRGTARAQIVQAMVSGIDSRFSLLPRHYSPHFTSTTAALLNEDGSITIHIDTAGEESEEFVATHTTLTGTPRM